MGGRGGFLESGGFSTPAQWHSVGLLYGVKVLEGKDSRSRSGLPGFSNTPGTAYVAVNKEGKFHQLRQYGEDRRPVFDIDYGVDAPLAGRGNRAIHIHEYDGNGVRQPGRWLTDTELRKYRKFFKGGRFKGGRVNMQGTTYDEFATMVRESWEIEYAYGAHEYLYQRSGHDGVFEIYVLQDGEVVYHKVGEDMDAMAAEVLALRIYDGGTAEEAEAGISVEFEA